MVEQTPVDVNEQKPDESPSAPTPDLGTSITGSGGADAFGLGSNRTSDGAGVGGKRASSSRFGWYAAQVQATVSDLLRNHPKTRLASFQIEVRLWPDLTGRITRAKLVGSTGNASMDEAIKTEVLAGLQLREPPPRIFLCPSSCGSTPAALTDITYFYHACTQSCFPPMLVVSAYLAYQFADLGNACGRPQHIDSSVAKFDH